MTLQSEIYVIIHNYYSLRNFLINRHTAVSHAKRAGQRSVPKLRWSLLNSSYSMMRNCFCGLCIRFNQTFSHTLNYYFLVKQSSLFKTSNIEYLLRLSLNFIHYFERTFIIFAWWYKKQASNIILHYSYHFSIYISADNNTLNVLNYCETLLFSLSGFNNFISVKPTESRSS